MIGGLFSSIVLAVTTLLVQLLGVIAGIFLTLSVLI